MIQESSSWDSPVPMNREKPEQAADSQTEMSVMLFLCL